ncbi:hypothetical protein H2201_000318 [Coniosporium apollinis]|uniref:F-box domain-containing protein n=1 Tax=Coniosporium apollinis TaxID=61459 RepID=A0ABQ9P4D6_9PEZI|nr:hypothetical protein H2201_000318 [Coniosporium apollinis]
MIEQLGKHIPAFLRTAGIEWYPCDPWNRVGPNGPFGKYLAKPVCLLEVLLSRLPNVQRIDFFRISIRSVNGFLSPDTSRVSKLARDPRPVHNVAEVNLGLQNHRQDWDFELVHSIFALPGLTRLSLRFYTCLERLMANLPSPGLMIRSLRLTYCKVNTSVLCSLLEACEALEVLDIDDRLYVVELDWDVIGSGLPARFPRLHTILLPEAALMDPMRYEYKEMLAMTLPPALRQLFIHNAILNLDEQLAVLAEILPRRFPCLTDVHVGGPYQPPGVPQPERSEQELEEIDVLVKAFAKVGAKLQYYCTFHGLANELDLQWNGA